MDTPQIKIIKIYCGIGATTPFLHPPNRKTTPMGRLQKVMGFVD
jgi:hypothetical protein